MRSEFNPVVFDYVSEGLVAAQGSQSAFPCDMLDVFTHYVAQAVYLEGPVFQP